MQMYKVVFEWHMNFHTQGQSRLHTVSLAHTTHTLTLSGNTAVDDGRTGQQHELSEGEQRLLYVPSLPSRDRRSSPAVSPSSVYSSSSRLLLSFYKCRFPCASFTFPPSSLTSSSPSLLTPHLHAGNSLSYALCFLTFYFAAFTIIHTHPLMFSLYLCEGFH